MLDKKLFEQMREEIESFDGLREVLIKTSRDVLKCSKGAIYSLHRNEVKTAEKQLFDAQKLIDKMNSLVKKDLHLSNVGAYGEALEEFVEAKCYFDFTTKNKIPSPKDLGVDTDVYLPGLCDLIGELVRKAINSVLKDDIKTALSIRDFVEEVYEELMMFDFRNSPLRKKFDGIKYSLEKLEDLALKIKTK